MTARAVVLKTLDHGEGHRIVELLTRPSGLVRAFAPAARRSRRRFGGALEPGTRLEVTYRRRPGRDLAELGEASVRGGLVGALRADLDAMLVAGYVLDLVRALVRDGQPDPALHDLLVTALEALEGARFPPWGVAAVETAALVAYGAAPMLDGCARCGRRPEAEASRFAPSAGGLLCPGCEPRRLAGDRVVRRGTLAALGRLARAADGGDGAAVLEVATTLDPDTAPITEAREVLGRCIEHLLGRALKSRALLASLT